MVVVEPSATLAGPSHPWGRKTTEYSQDGVMMLYVAEDIFHGCHEAAARRLLHQMQYLCGHARATAFALASRLYESSRAQRRGAYRDAIVGVLGGL